MRDLEGRLQKLEALLGDAHCTCPRAERSGQRFFVALNKEAAAEAEAQFAACRSRHAADDNALVVRILSFEEMIDGRQHTHSNTEEVR